MLRGREFGREFDAQSYYFFVMLVAPLWFRDSVISHLSCLRVFRLEIKIADTLLDKFSCASNLGSASAHLP
jgi:hypothetical protein